MATSYRIVLGSKDLGNFHSGGYNAAAAAKVSEVLQLNLEKWTIIFSGLRHNHIVHCILTIYALGASPEEIQKVYDREASYQRPRYPVDEDVVNSLADRRTFRSHLGQQPHYSNYLLFFQREVEQKGVKVTLEEHLFANDEHSNRMFALMYNGIFHPYLHLGYAFEFNQPALVAEALAMAAVHDPDMEKMGPVFTESERLARESSGVGHKSLRELMEDMRADKVLASSIDGDNQIDRSKNVADHAMKQMVEYAARYSLSEDQLEDKMHEMIDTCSLLIATKPLPIRAGEPHKIDFFLLHSVNTLAMVPSLAHHQWISRKNAVRMMEWAGRCHMLNYVSQAAPPLTSSEIDRYPRTRTWDETFEYSINHPSDDGHLAKCIRSLAFADMTLSGEYQNANHRIKPSSWLRLANLVCTVVNWEAETSAQRWLLSFPDLKN